LSEANRLACAVYLPKQHPLDAQLEKEVNHLNK